MYKEIEDLTKYCMKIGVEFTFSVNQTLHGDAYKITFANGDDCIQNFFSYGGNEGMLEFACCSKSFSYKPVSLKQAKSFVKRNKDKLNNKNYYYNYGPGVDY